MLGDEEEERRWCLPELAKKPCTPAEAAAKRILADSVSDEPREFLPSSPEGLRKKESVDRVSKCAVESQSAHKKSTYQQYDFINTYLGLTAATDLRRMALVPVMCLMTGACLGLTPIFPKVSGWIWPTVSALACCGGGEGGEGEMCEHVLTAKNPTSGDPHSN